MGIYSKIREIGELFGQGWFFRPGPDKLVDYLTIYCCSPFELLRALNLTFKHVQNVFEYAYRYFVVRDTPSLVLRWQLVRYPAFIPPTITPNLPNPTNNTSQRVLRRKPLAKVLPAPQRRTSNPPRLCPDMHSPLRRNALHPSRRPQ